MSSIKIDHVLVTRFNVPTAGRERLIRAKDGWLRERVALFEKYCLPSVNAQSNQNFSWLVYFDPQSPSWLTERLRSWASTSRLHAVYRTSVSHSELVSDLRELTGATGNVLITTNLDNDDGIALDFVERLQRCVVVGGRSAAYITYGIILRDSRIYLRKDRKNAFCSVIESWSTPSTAWADWHNRLGLSMPVIEISGPPGWLQVIHGRNVSNVVHGRLTSPSSQAHRFPFALATLPEPGRANIALDAIIRHPLRSLRSSIKTIVKLIVLRMLGRDGFDSTKNRVAEILFRFSRTGSGRASRTSRDLEAEHRS